MSNGDDWDDDQDFGYEPDDDDDLVGYDATEEEGRRRPLMILSVIVLLAVFGGVVYLAYSQGFKQGAGNGTPPLIRADTSPVKVAPEKPGGVAIPHQDKTVYERISGGLETSPADEVEQLLPRAEEPLPMGEAPAAPVDQPVTEPLVSAAPVAPVETAPSVPAPVAEVPATVPDTTPAPVVTATSGDYVVQLAAFRDEASALAAFIKLQKKYGAELAGTQSDIQRADLGDKGIYYRLRAGYMDKAGAQALCETLSKQGQSCFVRAK
ncbi:MAG: hypothetical protein GC184_12295 [Rhizobiales bacterium]|nr:hypothetical protein [Hyphomicrobiales bacterium]